MGVSWESLGLLEALLGSFKSEKMLTVPRENHLFVNAVFWLFAAPNGSLGLILVRLGRIWFQNGFPKVFQNVIKSLSKNDPKKGQLRVPQWVSKDCQHEIAGLRHFLPAIQFCYSNILMFFFRFWSSLVGLGSLLGPLEALLGGLWTQKNVKTQSFLMVLKRLCFGL